MKNKIWIVTALVCLAGAGCRTADVNPAAAGANTGYVDFYTDSDQGLSWEVKETTEANGDARSIYAEYKELPGNILRVAVPAGNHRFSVWFYNLVTTGPQTVLVPVANSRVTPVHITFAPVGSSSVVTKSYEYRPTAMASRRVSRIATDQQQTFQIVAVAGSPTDYQPKDHMPYFAGPSK